MSDGPVVPVPRSTFCLDACVFVCLVQEALLGAQPRSKARRGAVCLPLSYAPPVGRGEEEERPPTPLSASPSHSDDDSETDSEDDGAWGRQCVLAFAVAGGGGGGGGGVWVCLLLPFTHTCCVATWFAAA